MAKSWSSELISESQFSAITFRKTTGGISLNEINYTVKKRSSENHKKKKISFFLSPFHSCSRGSSVRVVEPLTLVTTYLLSEVWYLSHIFCYYPYYTKPPRSSTLSRTTESLFRRAAILPFETNWPLGKMLLANRVPRQRIKLWWSSLRGKRLICEMTWKFDLLFFVVYALPFLR